MKIFIILLASFFMVFTASAQKDYDRKIEQLAKDLYRSVDTTKKLRLTIARISKSDGTVTEFCNQLVKDIEMELGRFSANQTKYSLLSADMLNNTFNKKNNLSDAAILESLKKKKAADLYGTGILTETGGEYRLMITFIDVAEGNNAGGAKVYFKKDKELLALDAQTKTPGNLAQSLTGQTPTPKPKKSAEELLQSLNKIAATANSAVQQYEEYKKTRKDKSAAPNTPPPAEPAPTTAPPPSN